MTDRRAFLRTFGAFALAPAAACATPALPPSPEVRGAGRTLLAGAGAELRRYALDTDRGTLALAHALSLPSDVFHACQHPSKPLLYVIGSNADTPKRAGPAQHYLAAARMDPASGHLALAAPIRSLPAFANHVSTDARGRFLAIACHAPSRVLVEALDAEGLPAARVADFDAAEVGSFAHQAVFTPDNRLMVCARGNDARDGKSEEPGAITWFAWENGKLVRQAGMTMEPSLGPRNLACHPDRPWCYVGMERGNRLEMWAWRGPALERRHSVSTLEDAQATAPRQRVGAVLVHPRGHVAYVANRADRIERREGRARFAGGDNAVAVFLLDPVTGKPALAQQLQTGGIEPRSIALDPSGQWLAAGNQIAFDGDIQGRHHTLPASVALFSVASSGKLNRHAVMSVSGDGLRWLAFSG